MSAQLLRQVLTELALAGIEGLTQTLEGLFFAHRDQRHVVALLAETMSASIRGVEGVKAFIRTELGL